MTLTLSPHTGVFGHEYVKVSNGDTSVLVRKRPEGWMVIEAYTATVVYRPTLREAVLAGFGLTEAELPNWRAK